MPSRSRLPAVALALAPLVAVHIGVTSLPHTDDDSGLTWVHGSCTEALAHGAETHMHRAGTGVAPHRCLACQVASAATAVGRALCGTCGPPPDPAAMQAKDIAPRVGRYTPHPHFRAPPHLS